MLITLTDEHWWTISDYCYSPVALTEAKEFSSFVYDRIYGFFSVSTGCHNIVMAFLYAFRKGYDNYLNMAQDDGIDGIDAQSHYADEWLKNAGTCFAGTFSIRPCVWRSSNLTVEEKRILGKNGLTEIGL